MAARARLAELRALRASGKKRLATYEVQEEEKLYEEVDEEGYKKVVRDRLDQDDFVIDDNGRGYADDGREDWLHERREEDQTDSEEDLPNTTKASKRKREEEREKKEKLDKGINKYFNRDAVTNQVKPKPVKTEEDDSFMKSLLSEMDGNVPSLKIAPPRRTVKSEERRKVRVLSPPPVDVKTPRLPKTPSEELKFDDDDAPMRNAYDDELPSDPQLPSSPVTRAVERKSKPSGVKPVPDDEEDVLDVSEAVADANISTASINLSGTRPMPKRKVEEQAYPSPKSSSPPRPEPEAVDGSAWNEVTTKLNVLSSSPTSDASAVGKLKREDAVEEDGSLRMFWLDYIEINGSLCLFGKVKDKSSGAFVSCFVKIDNILRKLYFLPREHRHRSGHDSTEEVDMKDVYEEVDDLMSKFKVGMHKIKPCSRKYAFEMTEIPREAEYLKLLYPYDKPALPMDLKGETFSHVFGTNTSLFEQFVLWRGIKGPCWLKLEGADFSSVSGASWCKCETSVSKPSLISSLGESEDLEAPPLTLMSVALRTTFNSKENKQEILAASARVYENYLLTDTTPPENLPCHTFTIMRPSGTHFPIGFEAETKKHRGTIALVKNEQVLLSLFLAKLSRFDPDALLGHQLEGVDYTILLSRMRELKTPSWHRIGRLKRSEWPKSFGKFGGSFFVERQLVAGRLLCDLANDLGKSLMTKCQSWSLSEMCELVLAKGTVRHDIDNEAALKSWATTKDGLMNYLNHCEADTYFIAAIALKVQMLPLTKVLTNLAGNSWARTLSGTRAERNEYILLHEFHKNKYICPDKVFGKGKTQKPSDEENEGEENVDVKKKDKFKGGLVFEPEKGLYDKFILVMDFNSLYPSIIQEYNICFTTVDRSEDSTTEEQVPPVPTDQAQGILPRLIATLVKRRKMVKGLMKDKRATTDELATWDIKQLALKLTANSMYGCLGYTRSRFYARPLAMLTTFKGREILRSTKDLAESTQLRVIYGDTDSVMINTNVDNMQDALKVGNEFKRAVNDSYKLLEIDIDNIFRRLLLHAKKKYAAINTVEIDGQYVDKLEVKGLDMRRREYCALAKEASQSLLNEILSGEESEVVVAKVHEYLRNLSQQMREHAVVPQKYIIYTKLGKNPKEYPNPDSMPSVQVALRAIAQGKNVRANDVMSFIITGDSSSSENAAKRAFAPQEVLKAGSEMKPDIDWYMYKQIFPPIERLCAPIDGTDGIQLAECLGLDTRRYAIQSSTSNEQHEIVPLESQIADEIRFKDAARLSIKCRACKESFVFEGLLNTTLDVCSPSGLKCPLASCGKAISNISVVAQLEHQIRQQTAKYYEGWLTCDDSSCGNRTRQISVYGHRCLGPNGLGRGCLGRMAYEYSDKQTYNQLLYFQSLWDVEKVKMKAKIQGREDKDALLAMAEHNRRRFATVKGVVDKYLEKCGRQWVAMDSLFSFAIKRE